MRKMVKTASVVKKTKRFVNIVEKQFKGVGLPMVYTLAAVKAGKGVNVIGPKGSGKTALIECLPVEADVELVRWNQFNKTALIERFGQPIDDESPEPIPINGKQVWAVPEISSLSEYDRRLLFAIAGSLQSEKAYRYVLNKNIVLFEDLELNLILATQPSQLTRSLTLAEFRELAIDRSILCLLFNPLWDRFAREEEKDFHKVKTKLKQLLKEYKSVDFDQTKIRKDVDFTEAYELFEGFLSTGRLAKTVWSMMRGYAAVLGFKVVDQAIIDTFVYFFRPYLEILATITKRSTEGEISGFHDSALAFLFKISEYNGYISKRKIQKFFPLSDRNFRARYIILKDMDLITYKKNGRRIVGYLLADWLQEFFEGYRNSFKDLKDLDEPAITLPEDKNILTQTVRQQTLEL